MQIQRIESDLLFSNMYLLCEAGHALVIDPCRTLAPFRSSMVYDYILLTHEHFDHISGVNLWKEKTGAPVMCSEACAAAITDARKNVSRYFGEFCRLQTFARARGDEQSEDYTCRADVTFAEDTAFRWQGHHVQIVSCPGHSDGSVLILIDGNILFSGDTILAEFPAANRMQGKARAVRKIQSHPLISGAEHAVTVYPGHFGSFVIKERDAL